jgi:hypothetical protein
MRQGSGPSCLLSSTTRSATLTIGLKFRMSPSDSVSDNCEGSNPLLKRNGSGRCRESSIFSESDAPAAVSQPPVVARPFPACLASGNVRLMKSGCQPQTVPTHSSDPKLTIPNHNFMRFWHWMQAAYAPWTDEKMLVDPLPYLRSGPGTPSTVCRSPWYDMMPAVGDIPIVRRFHSEREDLRFSAG